MFLIVQNDPQCPAGSCGALLEAAGEPYLTVAAYGADPFPDPAALTGVIVLGGEMGVHDSEAHPYLARVLAFMAEAVRSDLPLLGICLGGQLLAHACGATVSSPSPYGEQGVCQVELNPDGVADPLFRGVPATFVTFQLHNDSFSVPPGATLLASSAACPAQAFRIGSAVYALQFHPEVDRSIVSAWGALSTPPRDFLPSFIEKEAAFSAASHAVIANFISLAASPRFS